MGKLAGSFSNACAATEPLDSAVKSPAIQLGASMGGGFAITPIA